jgi:uncharacterized protein (TIGR02271 family)
MREEVTVERTPSTAGPADRPMDDSDETIRSCARGTSKSARLCTKRSASSRASQDGQQVSDTVKREEVRIDRDGDVDVEEHR